MQSNDNASSSGVSHRARWVLAIFAIAAIAASALYFSRGPAVQAEDSPKAKANVPKEPDVEFFPKPSASEEKILAAFEQPTELDFHETPLHHAIDFLKDKHAIEIQLDSKALEDGGMGTDTPVTCKVSGVSLRSGLRLMLSQIDLAFLIHNEVLLVTTEEVADAELVTRTYPVADLTPGDNYESLIEAITKTVVPPSWDEVGGPGSVTHVKAAKSLVISQTQDRQDEILQLLRSLRAARKASGVELGAVQADAAAATITRRQKLPRGRGGVGRGMMGSTAGMGGMGGGMGGGLAGSKNRSGEKSKDGKGAGGMGGGMF
jgi:hypothetical protein